MREHDGRGNLLVYTMTLTYEDGRWRSRDFFDYTDAWNWARREATEYAAQTGEVEPRIDYEFDYVAFPNNEYEVRRDGSIKHSWEED